MEEKKLRYDGYYVSEEQEHIRYDNGRRIIEPYYLYYSFFPDGTWVCKTTDTEHFPFLPWLETLDVETIRRNPDVNEPQLENKELVYQVGKWNIKENVVHIEWKNTHVGDDPMTWYFRFTEEEELETKGGEYRLRFRRN